jgi:hypothetical protein
MGVTSTDSHLQARTNLELGADMTFENVAFFGLMRCRLPEPGNVSPEIQQPT